jgi:hypothetical protein
VFHELASHNEDIKSLLEIGYAIAEDHGYLVIRDIPYLDHNGQKQTGVIVTKLVDVDGKKVTQDNHQIFFAGTDPYQVDGTPINGLAGRPAQLALGSSPDVVVQRSFSNKPDCGYFINFLEKYRELRRNHFWTRKGKVWGYPVHFPTRGRNAIPVCLQVSRHAN